MDEFVNRDRMIRGARYFVALSAAGLGLTFAGAGGNALAALDRVSPGFVLLAAGAAALDLLIGAVRYQIFLRRIRPDSPFSLPIRADLVNRFVSAVTPSQTGGGPGQVFILFKGGIPVPDALSFLAINFLSTMVFFLVSGGFMVYVFRSDFPGAAPRLLIRYSFLAIAGLGALVLLAVLRPEVIEAPCRAVVDRIGDRRSGFAGLASRVGAWVLKNIAEYRAACIRFIPEAPWLLVWSLLLTVVLYLNKFTLAYFVLRGLGVTASYVEVLAVQTLLQFVLYAAPTPGASGIAEITTAALMARFMDPGLLGVFTVAVRFFLLYLPAAAGGLVLIEALQPAPPEPAVEADGTAPALGRSMKRHTRARAPARRARSVSDAKPLTGGGDIR